MLYLLPNNITQQAATNADAVILGNGARDGTAQIWSFPIYANANAELVVECDITFDHYFEAYEGKLSATHWREGHMGFMLRATVANLSTAQYRGHGPIFGSPWRPENNPNGGFKTAAKNLPCGQLESWGVGVVPNDFEYLRKDSASPVMVDGRYKLMTSSKRYNGEIYSRYAISKLNAGSQYDPTFDTGDVLDNNWGIERANETLVIFDAAPGSEAAVPYSIRIHNLRVSQCPATCLIPDLRRIQS